MRRQGSPGGPAGGTGILQFVPKCADMPCQSEFALQRTDLVTIGCHRGWQLRNQPTYTRNSAKQHTSQRKSKKVAKKAIKMQIGQNEPKICISVDFCMCCADCNRKYDFAHKYIQKTKNAHFSALFANLLSTSRGPDQGPTGALPGPTGAYRGLPGPYRGPTGALPGTTGAPRKTRQHRTSIQLHENATKTHNFKQNTSFCAQS